MKKKILLFTATVTALAMLTACGTQTAATGDSQESAQAEAQADTQADEQPTEKGGRNQARAQVTAIDGGNVTLKQATEPERKEPQENAEGNEPQGEKSDTEGQEMSFDGDEVQLELTDGMLKSMSFDKPENAPDGDKPEGAPDNGNPQDKPQGDAPDGDKPQEKPEGAPDNGDSQGKPQGDAPDNAPNGGRMEDMEDKLEDVDISELAVGDVVDVVYDEDGTTIKYLIKNERPQ
jgi:hypothetical protein